MEGVKPCWDADAFILHLQDVPVVRVDAHGVWERIFVPARAKRRVLENAAVAEKIFCGEVRDMKKRLRETERRLTATVAEQYRRAEVALELKLKRDQDLR
eukprot:4620906-Pleurochrysis_carterae.AAC.1